MIVESHTKRAPLPPPTPESGEGSRSETRKATLTMVIVSWNSRSFLGSCLESIRRTGGGLNTKVVVVDNSSRDGSADFVEQKFPEVRLIRSGANLGFGRGNNLARSHAHPGYVLFLNPDTELQE